MKFNAFYNPLSQWTIEPPINKALDAATATKVYDGSVNGPDGKIGRIVIQNVSAEPVFYAFNQDASNQAFHGIIAADTGSKQGNGGVLSIDSYPNIQSISLYSVNASEVAIFKAHANN